LKAISDLKKTGVSTLYLLAGKGIGYQIRKEVEQLDISDSVEIVGQISFERMPEFYDRLHVYIQPSLQEGLPRSLIEAMSRACPCIGTDTGGIPELLDENFVLKNRDSGELANLIVQTDTSQWIGQANRNFEKAKDYQTEVLNEKRINFYQKFKQFYCLS
jgi:glycosyltransferase involved in cell wall biosynthesis